MNQTIRPFILLAGAIVLWAQAPSFEVASIKRSPSNAGFGPATPPPPGGPPPGGAAPPPPPPPFQVEHRRFVATNFTLFALLLQAYGIQGCAGPAQDSCELVTGVPAWAKSERYVVEAKAPGNSPDYTLIDF